MSIINNNKKLGKAVIIAGLLIMLCSVAFAGSLAVLPGTLLSNGDFESVTTSWSLDVVGTGNQADFTIQNDGDNYAQVVCDGFGDPEGWVSLQSYFTPTAGATYELSFYYKSTAIVDGYYFSTDENYGNTYVSAITCQPTTDWTFVTLSVGPIPSAYYSWFAMNIRSVAYFCLDDVSFVPTSTPTPTPTPTPTTPPPTTWVVDVVSSSSAAGFTVPSGEQTVNEEATLTATATALSGYEFSHWLFYGAPPGTTYTQNPVEISGVAGSSYVLTAVFIPEDAVIPDPTPKPLFNGGLMVLGALTSCVGMIIYKKGSKQ